MSKSENKKKYNPEEVLEDINQILGIFDMIEESDITKLNLQKLEQKITKITKTVEEKYKDDLDAEE